MELLNSQEIKAKTGKTFLADENVSIIAKLIYLTGISGFDKILQDKTQIEFDSVIHLIKFKKGILIRLAQSFKYYNTALSLDKVKSIQIENKGDFSFLQITTDEDKLVFAFKSSDKQDIVKFFADCKLQISDVKFVDKDSIITEKLDKYIEISKAPKSIKINTKLVIITLGIGVAAFLIAYFIFAKVGNDYLTFKQIFSGKEEYSLFESLVEYSKVESIRQSILITSVVGLAFGLLIGILIDKKK
jgi:hypothetical protein